MHNWDMDNPTMNREGVGDDYPAQTDNLDQPGLAGGEFPGAEGQTDAMADDLMARGQDTAFGGKLGGYGPEGQIGTIDQHDAAAPLDRDEENEQEAY